MAATKSIRYALKSSIVEARESAGGESLATIRGLKVTNKGDWVLAHPAISATNHSSGKSESIAQLEVLDAAEFALKYEPADA